MTAWELVDNTLISLSSIGVEPMAFPDIEELQQICGDTHEMCLENLYSVERPDHADKGSQAWQ
jgi:hypothetical protein